MKEKALALLACVFIALSASGFIYAQWNDLITISNTMEFGHLTLRFVEPLKCWDNETTKDVGKLNCYYTDPDTPEGYKALTVAMDNAYPHYEAHCNFTLKNVGDMTEHITDVIITPGTGLEVGETYLDANGKPIGWRLDDTVAHQQVLYIYLHNNTGMSLVCNMLWSEDDLTTPEIEPVTMEAELIVQITENAQECNIYSFTVEMNYEQVIP